MSGNQPARIRHGRETQTTSARREQAAVQLASTQGRGQGRGRRVRVPVDVGEGTSASGSRSRLARVSSSRQREEEEEEEEVPVPYHEPEGVPDVDPPAGEEDEHEDGYPGGSYDTSVLIHYHDHVAQRIWEREVFFLISLFICHHFL